MLNTNALLSIAFALIASFTNNVPVPPNSALASTNDLEGYVVGPPLAPLDLALFEKRGTRFWLHNGVVQSYESPNSCFQSRGLRPLTNYVGPALLNSNQALHLATVTIGRLTKGSNQLANVVPQVTQAVRSVPLPFYRFTWRPSGYTFAAQMEIDARRGEVVSLSLEDRAFFDYPFARYMSNTVYRPDPKPPATKRVADRTRFRPPTADEVQTGITNWLALCSKLAISPGEDMSLARIDWERSYVYTNNWIARDLPVCQIHFKNGTRFECTKSVVIGCCPRDSYTSGTDRSDEEWERFEAGLRGRVTKRWQDLAKAFQQRLSDEFHVSQALLSSFPPALSYSHTRPPELGGEGITRCLVRWHDPKEDERLSGSGFEAGGAFAAEFDLRSGETKMVVFNNTDLVAALARVQLGGR